MRFSFTALAAFAAAAAANSVDFVNQDGTTRTVYFTASIGHDAMDSVTIPGNSNYVVDFAQGWQGNWWSVSEGGAVVPGMLGEVTWNGWNGLNYFDVSAIVDPNDHNGVKMLYPALSKLPLSGCQDFPCANAYNQPDDIQTLSTTETELVCLLGNLASSSKTRRHPRHFLAHILANGA